MRLAIVDDEWQCREQIAVAMDGIGGLELAKHILYLTKEKKDTIWQSPADVYQRGKICLIRDGGRCRIKKMICPDYSKKLTDYVFQVENLKKICYIKDIITECKHLC